MIEAWIAFAGVIVGGFITTGFNWFLEERRYQREQKIYLLRKKEDAYLKALDFILYPSGSSDERIEIIKQYRSKLRIFGSSNAIDLFDKIVLDITNQLKIKKIANVDYSAFAKQVQKELGISED